MLIGIFYSQIVESSSLVSVLFREAISHPYISFFHLLVNGFSVISNNSSPKFVSHPILIIEILSRFTTESHAKLHSAIFSASKGQFGKGSASLHTLERQPPFLSLSKIYTHRICDTENNFKLVWSNHTMVPTLDH